MRILLTNDDGINGEGLAMLAAWITRRNFGELVIAAPSKEQSASSMSINFHRPFRIEKTTMFSDIASETYVVDSTPADCVRFGLDRLGQFDLVFSGINKGVNIGQDICYSGTCGAAFEANTSGVKAAAFSTEPGAFDTAEPMLDPIWDMITERRMFDFTNMININIPKDPSGIAFVSQGGPYYRDHIVPIDENVYEAQFYVPYIKEEHPEVETDLDAFFRGMCSITPMHIDRTDWKAMMNILGQ